MAIRDIYLKIEAIASYNPVNPEPKPAPPRAYRRDCMRNMGHEDGNIPPGEVNARQLSAIVYREYLDAAYTVPKIDKLISADVNEPLYYSRVPGTVIYAHPGERLRIHVLNDDDTPHSFHVHGLRYGIDGDGAWPLGTTSLDGRRSDEICPGDSWIYTYDVTAEMVGAWPFHDHCRNIGDNINRGLFGGIIVKPKSEKLPPSVALPKALHDYLEAGKKHHPGKGGKAHDQPVDLDGLIDTLKEWADLEGTHPKPAHPDPLDVPLFLHFMNGPGALPAFDSPDLNPGALPFPLQFNTAGTWGFHCRFHPTVMKGTVNVVAGGPDNAFFNIVDSPVMKFVNPADGTNVATVKPGGTVHWIHLGMMTHSVTEDGGGMPSYCLNGRSFVGNTPTVEAVTGQKIRWYVFNLDIGMMWHNFHTHAMRWQFAGETIDVRSLSPVESFVVETAAPTVLLLPPDIEEEQEHPPKTAKKYHLRADFLVHCHVEMHMMAGLAGVVRAKQTVWLTDDQAKHLRKETGLPIDPMNNLCQPVPADRCVTLTTGKVEDVPGDPPVTMMHSALIPNTDKVLFWGYHTPIGQSRIWDPAGAPGFEYVKPLEQLSDVAPMPSPPAPVPELSSNMHSAGHAYLDNAEGTLLAHGGESWNEEQSFLFHPATMAWERTATTHDGRFYPTTITLADGRLLTLFGSHLPALAPSRSIEIYNPGPKTWDAAIALPASFNYYFYPWTYLLPGGDLFIAGHQGVTVRFAWTPAVVVKGAWPTVAGERSFGGELGTSVLLPLRPPFYEPRVLIAGGAESAPPGRASSAELIDLSLPTPTWTSIAKPLNKPRPEQTQTVMLPDGRVFLVGGVSGSGGGTAGPSEIFDPENAAAGWEEGPMMHYARGYHSSAILLDDGSVLIGGDPSSGGMPTKHERYYPSYCYKPRPAIDSVASASVTYGSSLDINTHQAPSIKEVVLLRPGAVTHGFNQSQRFIGCTITHNTATQLTIDLPPDGNVAPPGYYLLFVVDTGRVPSKATWIRLHH